MDACGIARRPARHACAVALDDAPARHDEGTRGSTQAHPGAAPHLSTFAAGLRACPKSLSARTHPRGKLDDEGAHSHRAKTSRAHRADRPGTGIFFRLPWRRVLPNAEICPRLLLTGKLRLNLRVA